MKEYYNITFDENGFEEKSDMMLWSCYVLH
jgi:hypothetical protein